MNERTAAMHIVVSRSLNCSGSRRRTGMQPAFSPVGTDYPRIRSACLKHSAERSSSHHVNVKVRHLLDAVRSCIG